MRSLLIYFVFLIYSCLFFLIIHVVSIKLLVILAIYVQAYLKQIDCYFVVIVVYLIIVLMVSYFVISASLAGDVRQRATSPTFPTSRNLQIPNQTASLGRSFKPSHRKSRSLGNRYAMTVSPVIIHFILSFFTSQPKATDFWEPCTVCLLFSCFFNYLQRLIVNIVQFVYSKVRDIHLLIQFSFISYTQKQTKIQIQYLSYLQFAKNIYYHKEKLKKRIICADNGPSYVPISEPK